MAVITTIWQNTTYVILRNISSILSRKSEEKSECVGGKDGFELEMSRKRLM